MSSKRNLRSNGTTGEQTLDSTKNYKYNSSGTLVEATTVGNDDVVFSGSKSSLRRMADLERNLSILAAKALTDDGTSSGYGSTTDYATRAGKWATARTITLGGDLSGSVSIDGSASVTLTATVATNKVALGTDTTGNYMSGVTAGAGISVTHTAGEGSTATIASTITQYTDALAVSANTSAIATAKSEAISSAATDATTKANAAQAAAISSAATDATTKANAAQAAAAVATNLTSGTVPNARIAGTYTGLTNLTGSGTVDFSKFYGNAADTAALPSFSWTTDANTGIWAPAADQVGITTGGVNRVTVSSTGIACTGEVTAYASDARLKTNVVAIDGALDKVEAIRGVTYDWNEKGQELGLGTEHQVGVIAQEIEAVLPQLVVDSAHEGFKTVKYDKLTALLIEAVKELSAKVKTLEARLGN